MDFPLGAFSEATQEERSFQDFKTRLSGLLVHLFTAGCLLHQSDAVLTKWIFTGEVYCDFQTKNDAKFLFDLDVWESDAPFYKQGIVVDSMVDDYLKQNHRDQRHQKHDSDYELYFRLQHRCTPDRSLQTKYIDVDTRGRGQETVKIRDGTFEHKHLLFAHQWRRAGGILERKEEDNVQ